jgi:hypothetical protein
MIVGRSAILLELGLIHIEDVIFVQHGRQFLLFPHEVKEKCLEFVKMDWHRFSFEVTIVANCEEVLDFINTNCSCTF